MAAYRGVGVVVRVFCATAFFSLALAVQTYAAFAAPDSAIVVDAKTGKTLYADNPDAKRYPASLTKMMTLYLLFDALHDGRTSLDAKITVSAHAAAQEPTKLDVPAGDTISVRDAILSVVTLSANDIAVAIGEYLGGSERTFAAQMTAKARDLGMSNTTFRNASGLPDSGQMTTARDMATLGRALREHFPEYYSFFSTRAFVWDGQRIDGHDPLLGQDGVDGIKTGYTVASGFNLVTSVNRDGRQIVAVVIGGDTADWRDAHMQDLVDTYFPKASTGPHIAAAIPGGPAQATATLVAVAAPPLPHQRPVDGAAAAPATVASATLVASATAVAPATSVAASVPLPTVASVAAATSVASAASLAPPASVASLVAADTGFTPTIAQGDTSGHTEPAAAPPAVTGWKIQIAAAPTRSGAEDILDKALSTGQKILASATPYTEPVAVGKDTLYRARFSGFANQDAARAACSYLVKRNFECLAISN